MASKPASFYLTSLKRVLDWASSRSLWYSSITGGCCVDEVLASLGARYDLERFGCVPQVDPGQADLLIVAGAVTYRSAPYLKEIYESMGTPRYVIALGSCANCGGTFAPEYSYSVIPGADRVIPVDVYVPGCPPRPEAIMNGIIALQERITSGSRDVTL